jgi:hypothetical protein
MTKQQKAKWVKSLLSGNFKQCKDALCISYTNKETKFCCLGVAERIGIA